MEKGVDRLASSEIVGRVQIIRRRIPYKIIWSQNQQKRVICVAPAKLGEEERSRVAPLACRRGAPTIYGRGGQHRNVSECNRVDRVKFGGHE